MRKWYFIVVGVVAACVLALVVLAMLPSGSGVTKANFDRVKKGMTVAEVVKIFGKEPDERLGELPPEVTVPFEEARKKIAAGFQDRGEQIPPEFKFLFEEQEQRTGMHWIGENNSRAMFDIEGGRITEMVWIDGSTLFDRFQRFIHWPWWD